MRGGTLLEQRAGGNGDRDPAKRGHRRLDHHSRHSARRPGGPAIAQQVLDGIATFKRTGGTDTATLVGNGTPESFYAFCLEPHEAALLNTSYNFTVAPLEDADSSSIAGGIGSTKATRIAQLFGQFAPNLAIPMTATEAAALQVAVWEIVSEATTNSFNLLTGNSFFTPPASSDFNAVLNTAQGYLNDVGTADSSAPRARGLEALTVNGNQDFLVQTISSAPEPGDMADDVHRLRPARLYDALGSQRKSKHAGRLRPIALTNPC